MIYNFQKIKNAINNSSSRKRNPNERFIKKNTHKLMLKVKTTNL